MHVMEHPLLFVSAGSDSPVPFIIGETTGVISVSSEIDRETIGDSFTLTVKVGGF